ncbi:hypothetical protein ACQR3C_00665 [Clostridium perfringens]|uniref:hypothetical protein n=1 Tax=Clostridium perfringens TaxID=1502 RepID=UPI000DA2D5CA|nr:hypothetical protein [Clostridium perfringens]MDG6876603.1 hypothetical protein [Clostridium perfringens]MDH5081946.1 hypothetical protein [Clostridium perfringens]MDJ8931568.1 hypothetical protein [Clostridium perfringens]MDJ8937328.1 hypothetical protein [Clostridium perfringens]MDJ8940301.1 hypothetical protein [Clostridium perfringens]
MGIKQMQGTSSYLEYVGPKGRKYKKNCIYNDDGICKCVKINCYMSKCVGRLYCTHYDDSEKKETNKNKTTFMDEINKLSEFGKERERFIESRREKMKINRKK